MWHTRRPAALCGRPKRASFGSSIWALNIVGYFSDTCRTFAVEAAPTDLQMRSWEKLVQVLMHVEQRVKPGMSCRLLYFEAKEMLDGFMPAGFFIIWVMVLDSRLMKRRISIRTGTMYLKLETPSRSSRGYMMRHCAGEFGSRTTISSRRQVS